jgi:D-alanyl-D-alanine carboxypeptidase/D-alanyl-D-alanine-endopeptidase (penicillin-binding protein 4)
MKKVLLLTSELLLSAVLLAQTVSQRLQNAFHRFETDSQLRHAISSLYVIDAATGKVVFDKNSHIGLAPASTQKIVTATTAFELLGKDYRYKTKIGYDIGATNGILKGNLYIEGDGDPTLGSGRWEQTTDSSVLRKIKSVLISNGVRAISGDIWIDDLKMGINPIPDGWIWQDIGNYYGAGARGLNWKENQYDLVLKSAPSPGVLTDVIKTDPALINYQLSNFIRTGEKGSGDNGYIYFAPYASTGVATGTIPSGISSFTISGSIPNPAKQFGYSVSSFLKREGFISDNSMAKLHSDSVMERQGVKKMTYLFDSLTSPSLDSMVYWFLRKSINLYGEAFIKTLAAKKYFTGSTDSGVAIVKEFWKGKGLDEEELNLYDGSGLSPLNRITTHAQVEILKYAKTKDWFRNFYDALPEYNGMKMKSGTISDVKGFCGYHKSKDGKEYIFSFLVNNYSGKTAGVVHKMYKVLDELK